MMITKPTNVVITKMTGFVRVTWDEGVSPATIYTLYRSIDNGAFVKVINIAGGVKQYDDYSFCNTSLSYKVVGVEYDISAPTIYFDLTAQFIIDTTLAQLDWLDRFNGTASYEIWSSINSAAYRLVGATAKGAITYNDITCKQGASMRYQIKAKVGGHYYGISSVETILTPLCVKVDMSTLTPIVIQQLKLMDLGGTVNINWGDGTDADYTYQVGSNLNITKNYAATGQYNISFSGNVSHIHTWEFFEEPKLYGDLTNWILPSYLSLWHFYSNSFTGDISDHINYFPTGIHTYHLGNNVNITGNLSTWRFASFVNFADLHLENCALLTGDMTNLTFPTTVLWGSAHYVFSGCTGLTGDISNWVLPEGLSWFTIFGCRFTGNLTTFHFPDTLCEIKINDINVTNTMTGNASGWVWPTTPNAAMSWLTLALDYCNLTGDMSGVLIPAYDKRISIGLRGNHITKLPRGEYRWVNLFNVMENSCDTTEIDTFLGFLDNYFNGGVVPLISAVYSLSGSGMGIPSATGLASRASIIGKYVAAGFTAIINVNS